MPAFFVVTKIDLAPEHVLKHTLQTLSGILKKPGVRKRPFLVSPGRRWAARGALPNPAWPLHTSACLAVPAPCQAAAQCCASRRCMCCTWVPSA